MKSNFFTNLLSSSSAVSSKRFAGLTLVGVYSVGEIISLFSELSSQTLQLFETGLFVGAGLLGLNIVESTVKAVKGN